jgi:iron complex outermembrane receptor protein
MYGDWTVGLDVSKILHLSRVTAPGLASVDVLDTFGNPVDLRARGELGWKKGPMAAHLFVNYTDEYRNTAVTPNQTVSDYTTVDASLAYNLDGVRWGKGARIVISGQNIFDRDPPVVLNGTLSWDSQAASPIGRFLSVEVSKRF